MLFSAGRLLQTCRVPAVQLRHVARFMSSGVDDAQLRDVDAVQSTLEEALDNATYIRDSAQQAMLEADPTSREPRDSYLARYQAYARDELDAALSKYDQLQGRLGEEQLQRVQRRDGMRLLRAAADSMLLRDNLNDALRPVLQFGDAMAGVFSSKVYRTSTLLLVGPTVFLLPIGLGLDPAAELAQGTVPIPLIRASLLHASQPQQERIRALVAQSTR